MLNFNNPIAVDANSLSSGLDFDFTPTAGAPIVDTPKLEVTPKETPKEVETAKDKPTDTTITPETPPTIVGKEVNFGDGNEDADETLSTAESTYENLIDKLAENGFINEPYEGFENDPLNDETFSKLLEHNWEKRIDKEFEDFSNSLSPMARKVLQFDLNAKGQGIKEYLQTMVAETAIQSLDPKNVGDQEKILKEWYMNKEGSTESEVEEIIKERKEAGLLEKEALRIKPKLDEEAKKIVENKEQEKIKIREVEEKANKDYSNKVIQTLEKGNLNGIKLSQEDAKSLYSIMAGGETDVILNTGEKVKMPILEALVFYNKYHEKGSIERLALATLLLVNPEKFEKEYSARAETKVTEKFVREHKYNREEKKGEPQKAEQTVAQNKWFLKIK